MRLNVPLDTLWAISVTEGGDGNDGREEGKQTNRRK